MAKSSRTDGMYPIPAPLGGVDTRVYPTSLTDGEFQMLRNIEPFSKLGAFATRGGTALLNASVALGPIRGGIRWYYGNPATAALILANDSGLYRWAGGTTYTSINAGMTAHRLWIFATVNDFLYIFNGIDTPQVYDGSTIRDMGFPAPGSSPVLSFTVTSPYAMTPPLNPAFVDPRSGRQLVARIPETFRNFTYTYRVTFVYNSSAALESSAATSNAFSAGIWINAGGNNSLTPVTITLSLTGIPTGGSGVTSRRIYRTKNGGTDFFFVGTINDNVTTTFGETFNDTMANPSPGDSVLGTTQGPTDNGIPPAGQFAVMWRNRLCVAKSPSAPQRVFLSATSSTEQIPGGGGLTVHGFGPEIFPATNFIDVGDDNTPVTGLAVIQDRLVVFKQSAIYTIDGNDASSMQAFVANADTGCIAPKTIVGMGGTVWFLGRSDGVPTVYMFDGDRTEPLSYAIEPTLKANMVNLGLTDTKSVDEQPTACRYRGSYMLTYVKTVGTPSTFETALFDTKPPHPRWMFWDGLSPSCWIPWNGAGDSGQMYYGDLVNGYIVQIDTGSQDHQSGAAVNVVGTVKTGFLSFEKPQAWKVIERIEAYATAQAGTTFQVDRYFNYDTTTGVTGSAMSLAAHATDLMWNNEVKAIQDCNGSDSTTPEQGMIVQFVFTLTGSSSGPAEVQRILVWYRAEDDLEVRRPA